jgi:hypothetical protein
VVVVMHHRIRAQIDSEDSLQFEQFILNPLSSMRERLTSYCIFTTKKSTANAA